MDEMTRRLKMKSEVWETLKKTVKALKEPKNILLLGSFGTGKSSFINTVITTLTGKNDYYVDIGCGSKHNTTRFQRISREEYWNPDEEVDKFLNLPAFIDIIGMDPLLSTSEDEETVNSQIMNLAINGKLPEDADLLDLGRKLKDKKQLKERPEEKTLSVDIIIVVISAENPDIPQALIDEIYKEANVKKKQIPVFAVITKVDKCALSEQELEDKKTGICEAIGIASDKVLMCSNYQPNQLLDTNKDISILEFLTKLCNPRFKAVTLQKMECEEPEPEPEPAPVPGPSPPKNDSPFGVKLLQGAFLCLVIAILLGMILHLLSKDRKYKS